jgi:hypothetical protein
MMIDLINLRTSDRFTYKIKVYPRQWSRSRLPHKFRLVLFDNNVAIRCSHHPSLEDAERSIREFLKINLDGDWEIYDYIELSDLNKES